MIITTANTMDILPTNRTKEGIVMLKWLYLQLVNLLLILPLKI